MKGIKIKRFISLVSIFTVLMGIFFSFHSVQSFAETNSSSGKTKVTIHYKPSEGNTKDWNLWVFPEGGEGKAYPFTGEDKFGKLAEIELDGTYKKVGFIVRTDSWEKDGGDRFIDIAGGEGEVWVKSGDDNTYTEPPDGEYRDLPAYEKFNVKVHYFRYDNQYDGWNLWTWPENGEGKAVQFTKDDAFGKVATIEMENLKDVHKLGFIVRKSIPGNDWAEKEFNDRYVTKFKEDGSAEVWIAQGQERLYYDKDLVDRTPKIVKASIDGFREITFETNFPFDIKEHGISLTGCASIKQVVPADNQGGDFTNKVKIITSKDLDLTKVYKVSKENFGEAEVQTGKVVRTPEFDNKFFYGGDDLGNSYSKKETKFRLWAPTASEAKLVMYKSWQDEKGTDLPLKKSKRGTWKLTLKGNHEGLIYTYKVKIGNQWSEAVDPYARAVTVNGQKGAVINLDKTDPKHFHKRMKAFTPEDAIIYELHVRDLSMHPKSGIKHKGKFLGVAEENTTGPEGVKTGLNHIKDLGVTHVQLLPIYDYKTVDETKIDQPQFNWGYDPQNYNAPEGSYSTDPYKPAVRIKEMKQMVNILHHNNLRVIMDVVYNHMFSADESNFQKLVPGYYFRYNDDGTLANGTGVGNDTSSERKMMRKFIVESVSYWAKEYNLDGFRFDLMGIHDVETMNQVRKALNKIDPSIIVLGEGWDLNTPLDPSLKANQKNAGKMTGIAHFNDGIRDSLKGSVFEDTDKGFVNGKPDTEEAIKEGVKAGIDYSSTMATYKDPEQVITYVEAHDNHTLWDKLQLTNPESSVDTRKKMHKLASSIILTSQGISFLHAGQEFMRTKGGDHNSYKSPDAVNQLDWQRRADFRKEVDYMKGLIKLRKGHPAFRMRTAADIRSHIKFLPAPKNTVAYDLKGHANNDRSKDLVVVYNANTSVQTISLPKIGPWRVLANGEDAGNKPLGIVMGKTIQVPALSTIVLDGR
ncbi:pullulanase [Fictibacillus enclensis]|uniref:pullulanase n=1 Tax=Fictibacillus enclensis TaxID=1017270 RepID=A0A0V8JB50_9BACL|nr:type I pullulanase [Fictibacillus enclensis]KSU84407.1 pullulanase [Fictibacillus enclensis]SCB78902.1 pullulanase [Fictibacillus enclensis]